MKKIFGALLGLALLLSSFASFAATEIWMMHSPSCVYCQKFLNDNGLEGAYGGEFFLPPYYDVPEKETPHIVIFNLNENLPVKVRNALAAAGLSIPYTPFFLRWDTETKTITSVWRRGWNIHMKDDFREWVIIGP